LDACEPGEGITVSAVAFTQADFDNLEIVRQIVFRRLKEDTNWNQLYEDWDERTASRFVKFDPPHLKNRFLVLMMEVMWQLITQGVITPGMWQLITQGVITPRINAPNPELPWFRVTSYGKTVLETERFVAHDPAGYLQEVKSAAGTVTSTAVLVGSPERAPVTT
jgi:hypothetical protein